MSRDCGGYDRPETKYIRFSDWCCEHEEVLSFIRTVCAVIGTACVIVLIYRGF